MIEELMTGLCSLASDSISRIVRQALRREGQSLDATKHIEDKIERFNRGRAARPARLACFPHACPDASLEDVLSLDCT